MAGLDGLKTSNMGIGKLLLDRRLTVPRYQRSYSWTTDEVLDLWNDLIRALDEGHSDYFLGTVVLSATSDEDGDSDEEDVPSVIDGQQRLATVSLLLVALFGANRSRPARVAANSSKPGAGKGSRSPYPAVRARRSGTSPTGK